MLIDQNSIYYDSKKLVYSLPPGVLFVFESNCKGIHGAGSAKTALLHFGARLGIAEGRQGMSYALATCSIPGQGLSIPEIHQKVEKFREFVERNPNLYFYVTRVACGYAGYRDEDIAPMFKGFKRCYFPDVWKPYLEGETPNAN